MFFVKVTSTGASLEDAVARIAALHQMTSVAATTYNGKPVVGVVPKPNVSNATVKVLITKAMKPYMVNIWKRPDQQPQSGRARN